MQIWKYSVNQKTHCVVTGTDTHKKQKKKKSNCKQGSQATQLVPTEPQSNKVKHITNNSSSLQASEVWAVQLLSKKTEKLKENTVIDNGEKNTLCSVK